MAERDGGHVEIGPGFWTKKEKIAWLEEYGEAVFSVQFSVDSCQWESGC